MNVFTSSALVVFLKLARGHKNGPYGAPGRSDNLKGTSLNFIYASTFAIIGIGTRKNKFGTQC